MNKAALIHEASSRPPAERAAFLDQACAGLPELRAAVEALLAAAPASEETGSEPPGQTASTALYEDSPAWQGGARPIAPPPADGDGARPQVDPARAIAGRYFPLEKLGEGGMGEIWIAQ